MFEIKFTNTRTRTKEIFKPLDSSHIRFYVCGPTVYDRPHLGNARPVVVFDVLYRLLKLIYPKVTYVRNITDVDDKINARSAELKIDIQTLTQKTIREYHEDMAALNALPPTIEPKATEHIDDMINIILSLIEKGHAYVAENHVLFDVSTFSAYGKLSLKDPKDLISGARVEVAPYKKNPCDFVLWKPSSDNLPGWPSPWGRGRPGWHIECSAMSQKYLGMPFDIHGGGIDLVFPHHENEIAQSCCAHNQNTMANFWLHNGHLTVHGEKMSKSLGNFFTVNDLLKTHKGETIRLALLMTHYRQPLDWTESHLDQARQTLDRFYGAINLIKEKLPEIEIPNEFLNALCDDLNTPLALSLLHHYANEAFRYKKLEDIALLKKAANLIGLLEDDAEIWFKGDITLDNEVELLIEKRNQAKLEKNYLLADEIRKSLLEKGIMLLDTKEGTSWRKI